MKSIAPCARILLATQLITLFASAASFADEGNVNRRTRRVASVPTVTTERTTRDLPVDEDQSGTGLSLFLGAGGTYYSVIAQNPQLESSKTGSGFQGKAGLNFFTRSLALELDAGWLQSTVNSSSNLTQVQGNTTSNTSSQVITRAGIVEFSPRYRFGDHFEAGPVAGVLFGTNASFGDTVMQPNSPILAGLKMAVAWQTHDLHFRVVGEATSTLTIPERQVLMGSLGLEIGLPLIKGKTIVRETEVKQVEHHEEIEYVETEVPVIQKVEVVKEVIREVVLFSFDDQVVHFEFDRAQLTPGSREFVRRLGGYLAGNPQLWSSLRIDGHTDSRGTPDYNQRLSEARAAAVREELVRAGIPAVKLASRGFGLTSPIDRGPSDVSRARNRRVELSFNDVNDAKALRDAINRIRFETAMPHTCEGGRCR